MNINYLIGSLIRNAREEKNLTVKQLAYLCKISPNHLTRLENGNRGLSIDRLISILNALEIDIFELLKKSR